MDTPNYDELNFYLKNAIQFKPVTTHGKQLPSVMIEVAESKKSADKGFDFANKIAFQLDPDTELVQLAQALIGRLVDKLEFKFHGPDKKKGMVANANQDGSFYISVNSGPHRIHNTLPPSIRIHVATFVIRAFAARHKIDVNAATNMLRMMPPAVK